MTSLTWPCDGECGSTITDGVDGHVIIESRAKDQREGQTYRLCMECAKTQLKRPEEVKGDQPSDN